MTTTTKTARLDVYTRVTNKIVEELEQGTRPWLKPWNAEHAAGRITRPLRHNGQPYKGINILMLWASAELQGFVSPFWLTFQQAKELGGFVKKGEHGSPVVFATRHAVCCLEQVECPETDDGRGGLLRIDCSHQLRDAINQDVAVVDRRQAVRRRLNLDKDISVLVTTNPMVGFCRQREDRMLHRSHVALRCGIDHIADKKVGCRISVRQKRGARPKNFSAHPLSIVISPIESRSFVRSPTRIVISPTAWPVSSYHPPTGISRQFTHRFSSLYTPSFDSLHTRRF